MEVYDLIHRYRHGDTDTFVKIVEKFNPLLNKYQRIASYDDMKSDLIEFMFQLISKIPLDKESLKEDKNMISYIHSSLKNRYIYLNKKSYNVMNKEVELENNHTNISYNENYDDIIFSDIYKYLTESEKDVINKIYILGLSESDISRMNKITRQSVNKTHKRALTKIKRDFFQI